MKVCFFETEEWEKEFLKESFQDHDVEISSSTLSNKNVHKYADANIISVFIYSELDDTILQQMPNLELITTRSTGFDHINKTYCDKTDILITNVPTYGNNTIAEHVFALILTISHNLTEATARTRMGRFSYKGLLGFDLRGKTIGIIGTGQIGRHVVKLANGFSMKIIAHDIAQDKKLVDDYGVSYVSLQELLKSSDVITLHIPLNKETYQTYPIK